MLQRYRQQLENCHFHWLMTSEAIVTRWPVTVHKGQHQHQHCPHLRLSAETQELCLWSHKDILHVMFLLRRSVNVRLRHYVL